MEKKMKEEQEAKGVKKSLKTQEEADSDEKKASTPAKPKRTPVTYLTEEDYKKYGNWSVGTFHRASTSPVTDRSGGEEGES